MDIYQGEPLGGKINIKDGSSYLPSLEGISLISVLADSFGKVVCRWSTSDGTISIGTETISGEVVGYAAFSVSGEITKDFPEGLYTLEIAKVLLDGKAIGVKKSAVRVLNSIIGRE